jgi:hypothetical protein
VAQSFELHPFEVVRILAASGALPNDLRLRPEDIARVVEAGGLEAWWESPPVPERGESDARALVRALAGQMLARGVVDPSWTRADNLFRGLDPRAQGTVRRAVNAWIRVGAMGSRMSARGIEVSVRPAAVEELAALADRGSGAYARLLEDG